MSRRNLATAFSVVLTALMMPSIHADDGERGQTAPPSLIPPPLLDQPTAMPEVSPNVGSYRPTSVSAALVSNHANWLPAMPRWDPLQRQLMQTLPKAPLARQ